MRSNTQQSAGPNRQVTLSSIGPMLSYVNPGENRDFYQSTLREQATTHINTLFGQQQGFVDLCVCPGDPSKDRVQRAQWFNYSGDAESLADMCLELGERHGDVYIGRSLYGKRNRDAKHALPSRVVFVDDAPAGNYSLSIKTSAQSRHGYFLLDCPVDNRQIVELQRNAAAALGADASGADVTQLVRVPGTRNTKAGANFVVEMEFVSPDIYTITELALRWPHITREEYIGAEIDWSVVERWNGNLSLLLRPNGLPIRFKPTIYSAKLLTGAADLGGDTSLKRAAIVKSLVWHGYPDEEVIAVASTIADFGASERKGSDWLLKDITRLIGKSRSEGTKKIVVRPTTRAPKQAAKPLSKTKRQSRGRTKVLDAEVLLNYYRAQQTCGRVMKTVGQVATDFAVSVPTIERLERTLKAQGHIERHVPPTRSYSYLLLL